MEPLGIVVFGVLAISVIVALVIARDPPSWDELGGQAPVPPDEAEAREPSLFDDEAELRALVAEKRARRLAAGGRTVASDRPEEPLGLHTTPHWEHLDSEVVQEARDLVARRRARLLRTGKAVPDEHSELVRLLGPPHR